MYGALGGVEPATFPLGGGRAIQLCHQGKISSILTCDFIKIYSNYYLFSYIVITKNNIWGNMKNLNHEQLIGQWHRDRNLIDGSTDKDQYMKLIQEAGELSDSLCKGKDIKDDIGDMMVVLINIMVRNNLTIEECLAVAYEDIKDRKGKMIDGIFVKEGDE